MLSNSAEAAYRVIKDFVRLFLPPIMTNALRHLRRNSPPELEYLPGGWASHLSQQIGENGWNVESAVSGTTMERAMFQQNLASSGPLGIAHEHNLHVTFAYVLAVTAKNKSRISVLDWGAGLGQYYHVAKAALPDIDIDYHCREVPVLAKAGAQLASGAHWHDSDTCLQEFYNLVFASGSLQYAQDWPKTLAVLAAASKEFLFLTRIPVVTNVATFAALQRVYGSQMLFWVFNNRELIDTVKQLGFELVREFLVQDWPRVKDAPEQCELRGWLFRRSSAPSATKDKA